MEKVFELLFDGLKKFLMRDLSFIIGGSMVILSLLFVYDHLPSTETPFIFYVLGIGVAYTVGYSIQDSLTVIRLVRTKAGMSPNKFSRALYKLFDRKRVPFPTVVPKEYEKAKSWLYKKAPERFRADHERIESLKQIGTSIGPCFIISGCILYAKPILSKISCEFVLATAVLIIGFILYSLGWLKVTQQAQYLLSRKQNSEKDKNKNNHTLKE